MNKYLTFLKKAIFEQKSLIKNEENSICMGVFS